MNSDKTVGMIFTKNKKVQISRLLVDNKNISFQKSFTFLGIILDSRLTWSDHISYIIDRSETRLNLMPCISGANWGASKDVLLLLYRALIRSILEYGSIAFESASITLLKKLDTIQYKALKIATGAFTGTAAASLQVACNELPLDLRRERNKLRYLLKINSLDRHSVKSLLIDTKRHNINQNVKSKLKQELEVFLTRGQILLEPQIAHHIPPGMKIHSL
jgi:hypothetical protein